MGFFGDAEIIRHDNLVRQVTISPNTLQDEDNNSFSTVQMQGPSDCFDQVCLCVMDVVRKVTEGANVQLSSLKKRSMNILHICTFVHCLNPHVTMEALAK